MSVGAMPHSGEVSQCGRLLIRHLAALADPQRQVLGFTLRVSVCMSLVQVLHPHSLARLHNPVCGFQPDGHLACQGFSSTISACMCVSSSVIAKVEYRKACLSIKSLWNLPRQALLSSSLACCPSPKPPGPGLTQAGSSDPSKLDRTIAFYARQLRYAKAWLSGA